MGGVWPPAPHLWQQNFNGCVCSEKGLQVPSPFLGTCSQGCFSDALSAPQTWSNGLLPTDFLEELPPHTRGPLSPP